MGLLWHEIANKDQTAGQLSVHCTRQFHTVVIISACAPGATMGHDTVVQGGVAPPV